MRRLLLSVGLITVFIGSAALALRADSDVVQAAAEPSTPAINGDRGTVKGSRCNVRSRPSTTAEVVAQLNKGDSVDVLESQTVTEKGESRDWVRIALPPSAKCFVHAQLVTDGVINADAVNVRCGPGPNYRDVGKLAKGETVKVLKTTGEWVQIKPTPDCSGWMAAELIEIEPPPAPPAAMAPPLASPPEPPPAPPAPAAPPASEIQIVSIDPGEVMGVVVKVGVLRSVAAEADAPAAYELLTEEVERRQYRICYVDAPQMNLSRYDGKNVRVIGLERWRKGDRWPVVVAERVDIVW